MPRLAQVVEPEVEAAATLSPELALVVKKELMALHKLQEETKAAKAKEDKQKEKIEQVCADGGAYEALEEGVRVNTPLGEVPIKIVGGTSRSLNKKKLMKKFKLTQKDLDSVTDETEKEKYLGVYWPRK